MTKIMFCLETKHIENIQVRKHVYIENPQIGLTWLCSELMNKRHITVLILQFIKLVFIYITSSNFKKFKSINSILLANCDELTHYRTFCNLYLKSRKIRIRSVF